MAGVLPNFLIIGAMKSGTTAFAHMLREHPDIYMPDKELHFFNRLFYDANLETYRSYFVGHQGQAAVGEKTPTYYTHPLASQRIGESLPGVRCIFIFRNPTARAYSHYQFCVQRATEYRSFRHALAVEAVRSIQEIRRYGFQRGYRSRGEYARHVCACLEHIPMDKMHFILYEEMQNDPARILAKCCRFLGVADDFTFLSQRERLHETHIPHNRLVHWVVSKGINSLFGHGNAKRTRIMKRFWKMSLRQKPGYPPMDADIKEELDRHFAPFNRDLAELTGLDTSLWQ